MKTIRIHVLQHVPFEGPGCIADWALQKGYKVSFTFLFKNQPLPSLASFDFLVLMGGPMSVNDENKFPWLVQEKELVRASINNGKKVLGICLGAQMIASALGKPVYANAEKEIGWFPVRFTAEARDHILFSDFPSEVMVFHWHGETFDIPDDSILVASSEACRNQGFVVGQNVVGLQFHMEQTKKSLQEVEGIIQGELGNGRWEQTLDEIKDIQNITGVQSMMYKLLNRLSAV